MYYIHINKKCFLLVLDGDSLLIFCQVTPVQKCASQEIYHKSNVFAAISCPFIGASTGELSDGKFGIWAFDKQRSAACYSKNRPKETMEWRQASKNKNKERYLLLNKVLPAVDAKVTCWMAT